jgi:L-fuconolactonase
LSRGVDSHLHVWDLEVSDYAWLGPQHGALFRSFGADEAARELAAAGVSRAVLVQAEDSLRDTTYLLDVADTHPFVAGVVGWVSLDDPVAAETQLDELAGHPAFKGVRHLVHDDPRDEFLVLPTVRTSLGLLAERGLPFDVPDAWPRHLADAAQLAAALPELTVVIDHLAKPPRGGDDMDEWEAGLRSAADRPNTVAKVSGLQVAGQPFTVDALRPLLHVALEAFGSQRLMYGGDWPLTVTAGGYLPHWEVVDALIRELSPHEQDDVRQRTAARVYTLDSADG